MVDDANLEDRSARHPWAETYRSLVGVPHEELRTVDLEALGEAAYLIGDHEVCGAALTSAYERHLEAGDRAEAARCSFWLALLLMLEGQTGHAGGWLTRTESTIGGDLECAATGYMMIPAMLGALDAGAPSRAAELAVQAGEVGERFGDDDLCALATLGHGQALIALGDVSAGLGELDEVMLSVEAGEPGLIASGIIYCAVILECMHLLDLARASEWTDELDRWCRAQPELVPFRGQCLVHQSQLRQAAGRWPEAMETAVLARQRLSEPPHPALGLAHYQEAELLRVLGSVDAAAAAYAKASRAGHEPMPGLALLELARGDVRAATAAIQRALQEGTDSHRRPALLVAAVDILRAAGDRTAARTAASELEHIAGHSTSEVVQAMAKGARGAVLLDDGNLPGALTELRVAVGTWKKLEMPYEEARTRALIGLACAGLGDDTSAALEFDTAGSIFRTLGAEADLAHLTSLADGPVPRSDRVGNGVELTDRELEVLTHVASGKTSNDIADELMISRHTVRRHLANIFAKLGVNSRAAATAYAYEHDLISGR